MYKNASKNYNRTGQGFKSTANAPKTGRVNEMPRAKDGKTILRKKATTTN